MRAGGWKLIVAAFGPLVLLAGCGSGGGSDSTATATASFVPKATLRAVGGTTRPAKPEIVLRVEPRPGDANIRSAKVVLPPVALVDAEAIRRLCGRSELESDNCAGRQSLGTSTVVSPALGKPLTGPVYVVSGPGSTFHLAYVLGGPTNLVLEGTVASTSGRVGAGIENVPDTPLRSFELKIAGGESGYLVLDRDICHGRPMGTVTYKSQEGQTYEELIPLQANCGG